MDLGADACHSDDKVYFEMEADGRIQEPIPVWTVRPGEWEHVVIHTATAVVMHDNLRVSGPPERSHP